MVWKFDWNIKKQIGENNCFPLDDVYNGDDADAAANIFTESEKGVTPKSLCILVAHRRHVIVFASSFCVGVFKKIVFYLRGIFSQFHALSFDGHGRRIRGYQ